MALTEFDVWRGLRPILVVGTCSSRGKKGRFPLARVVVLAFARSRTILTYAMGVCTEAEGPFGMPFCKRNAGDSIPGH